MLQAMLSLEYVVANAEMKMVIVCVLSLHEAVLIKLCAFLSAQFHRNNHASKIRSLSEHVYFSYT